MFVRDASTFVIDVLFINDTFKWLVGITRVPRGEVIGFEVAAGGERIGLKRVKSRVNRVLDECSDSINSEASHARRAHREIVF